MPRPKGIQEAAPRKRGGGRKPSVNYASRYATDPNGATDILLRAVPNEALAHAEAQAQTEGISVQEWIRSHLVQLAVETRIV